MIKGLKKQNSKSKVNIPFPVMFANFLVAVAVFGLSYVWLCARCDMLGKEIKRLEAEQHETCRLLNNEQDRWSSQLAPASLDRALKRHKLAMSLPRQNQIVRVHGGMFGSSKNVAYNR